VTDEKKKLEKDDELKELIRTPFTVRQALKNYERLSDEEVIARFQGGDLTAFDVIVARYKQPLIQYVIQFVGETSDAEDIVQDTFVKVFRRKQAYRSIAKFSTWLYTVAGNFAKSELRKRKRQAQQSISSLTENDPYFEVMETRAAADEMTDRQFKKDILRKAIQRLPKRFQDVIRLREIEHLSYDEIAARTKLSLGTVKSRVNRARLRLQKELKHVREK
jgi:RNA polymerase sigma-70 factor (ECF subfamily)